ncbi:uncharacterized protein LTR77_010295 [Saxophila tyrrhenica]|uniref:Uncharacterized protein n=1 Tax=Saxophila tyrrhenica TaxID=1690608 RepID=A0AAV9NZ28_9PEZI|nr:hypothetical protein LTR77_010295 [Saxophila tyrrhenica]
MNNDDASTAGLPDNTAMGAESPQANGREPPNTFVFTSSSSQSSATGRRILLPVRPGRSLVTSSPPQSSGTAPQDAGDVGVSEPVAGSNESPEVSGFSALLKDLNLDFEMPSWRQPAAQAHRGERPAATTEGVPLALGAAPAPYKFPVSTVMPGFKFAPRSEVLTPEARLVETLRGIAANTPNAFFQPSISLGQAAQLIHAIVSASNYACAEWSEWPKDKLVDLFSTTDKPTHPLPRMCLDFHYIQQFLEKGREGWHLVMLPDNFLADVEPLLAHLICRADNLCVASECEWLCDYMLEPLKVVQKKLVMIRGERQALWEQSKARYEREAREDWKRKMKGGVAEAEAAEEMEWSRNRRNDARIVEWQGRSARSLGTGRNAAAGNKELGSKRSSERFVGLHLVARLLMRSSAIIAAVLDDMAEIGMLLDAELGLLEQHRSARGRWRHVVTA